MVLGVHIYLRVTKQDFLEKIPIGQKWLKMVQKQGFRTFKESHVISFARNWCKTKVLIVH